MTDDDKNENEDQDTVPAAPGDSDTALGDTDQHSDAESQPPPTSE